MNTNRRPRGAALIALGYAFYLPILAGFVLHTSAPSAGARVLGKYSLPYALFLGALVLLGAAWPVLARALVRPTVIRGQGAGEVIIAGRRKAALAGTALALGVLVAALVVEVLSGVRGAVQPADRRQGPVDLEVFFDLLDRRGERGVNSRGFRGPDVDVEKPPGVYRIYTLGGSTTFLVATVNEEDTYAAVLERMLARARPAWRFEVVNAAGSANDSFQSLMKYAVLIQDFQPDLVTVMHGINDIQEGSLEAAHLPWKRPFERDYMHNAGTLRQIAEDAGLAPPRRPLWAESAVCARLADALADTFASDLRRTRGLSWHERQRLADLRDLVSLRSLRRNYRTLGQLTRARGARLLILSQPTMFRSEGVRGGVGYLTPEDQAYWKWRNDGQRIYDDAMKEALRRFNDAARDMAAEVGAQFVDLEAAVPAQWTCFNRDHADGIHMSEEGCRLTAQALLQALLPLIPEAPPARTNAE